ncbi:hypothetical protein JMJ55_06690 [Belnapia sp. T6]|uniref:HTTM domain-containing protein n=1 Tax=Belnapia mucosa TaxID=2804532 RepID=A0ABS1UZX2_9PROT|nr:hypothetical protein [Belnapia mucosa]MBL6455004.1 hypothetical protein [Belnapia mucosa]
MYSSRLRPQALRIPSVAVSLPFVLLLLSLLGYGAARKITFFAARSEPHAFALVVFCVVAALPFIGIRYADIPKLLRAIVRGIGVVIFAQVLFDSFAPVPPAPNIIFGAANEHTLFFRYGAMIGVAAGIASLWRPIFLIPLTIYYIAFRLMIGPLVAGIWVSDTDYASMTDTGLFATFGGIVAVLVTSDWTLARLPWLRSMMSDMPAAVLRQKATGLVWAMVVGAHLGNYFCSGVAKLLAGGPAPWTWLLQNPTQTAIVIGTERGDNPLMMFPGLLQFSWDAISEFGLAFNFFVLGAQLLCPLAILRVRWLLIFTMLFDVFHIGVYFTLGALFHFWIAVNLIIYTSAWRLKDEQITSMMKLVCVLTVMFGNTLFYTNWLGWLDGAKLASPQFYALTKDGREVWVPQVYYGIYSYTIAQAATYVPDGHFNFRIGGNNLNPDDWRDATSCGPRTAESQTTGATLQNMADLVHNTHAFMVRHPYIKNDNLYYLYPHHMQPNPWAFREFNRLSIDDIVGYKYVVESVCLTLRDGQLVRDVKKRDEFTFDVR